MKIAQEKQLKDDEKISFNQFNQTHNKKDEKTLICIGEFNPHGTQRIFFKFSYEITIRVT